MSSESDHAPRNTREFVAQWNDTVENHLVSQLAPSLPILARDLSLDDPAQAAALARPLVRALRLSADHGDAGEAIRYLADVAQAGGTAPASASQA